jgi:hypothetical protein
MLCTAFAGDVWGGFAKLAQMRSVEASTLSRTATVDAGQDMLICMHALVCMHVFMYVYFNVSKSMEMAPSFLCLASAHD